MYTQAAMNKMIDKERIKDNYSNQEQEAFATLQGDQLMTKINQLNIDKEAELAGLEHQFEKLEKEKESDIREELENKFFKEKESTITESQSKKENLIKGIVERNKTDSLVQQIGGNLLKASSENANEEKDRLDQEKERNLEKIRLQIVASNDAEVQEMQKRIEEQMQKEKESVEIRMKQRRDEVIGDKKKKFEERMREMSGQLSQYQRE